MQLCVHTLWDFVSMTSVTLVIVFISIHNHWICVHRPCNFVSTLCEILCPWLLWLLWLYLSICIIYLNTEFVSIGHATLCPWLLWLWWLYLSICIIYQITEFVSIVHATLCPHLWDFCSHHWICLHTSCNFESILCETLCLWHWWLYFSIYKIYLITEYMSIHNALFCPHFVFIN